jgi:hypothetical protein
MAARAGLGLERRATSVDSVSMRGAQMTENEYVVGGEGVGFA